jgi:DNA-binding transcriptional MerR regulator
VTRESELFTIEQLAARTGLTVRNIRSHITRGLVPPPHLKGRTGYYGAEHVARLQLVTGLQQQGFNLAAIRKLVAGPAAPSADETVAFYRTALGPWLTESPEIWDEVELAARFGLEPDDAIVGRLERLQILEQLPDGRIRVLNPALIRVGEQLAGLGYGIEDLLGVLQVLMTHSRSVAEAFVQMFLDVQWQEYVTAGMPPEQLPELRTLIEQLQPLAAQAVVAAFQQAMTQAVAPAFERAMATPLASEARAGEGDHNRLA